MAVVGTLFTLKPIMPLCAEGDSRPATHVVIDDAGQEVSKPLCLLHAQRYKIELDTRPERAKPETRA